jgi:peptidoglycan/LPS O-acetylase OafA/YrhL
MTNLKNRAGSLVTKPHFQILDGLRGVAALGIVVFHFMEWIYTDPGANFIGHGFLAVDFFFCLSGFVIGYAYDSRIKTIGIKEFFKSRLIRLQPMVVFGSMLGLLAFLFDPFATYQFLYSTGRIIIIFLSSLFLIPLPVMPERSFNLFSLNAPAWSLFWEYVANIFYALILYKLHRRLLWLLLIPAAIALVYITQEKGNILGGWDGSSFWDGGARILYSFTAGLLIYRYNLVIKNKIGFIGLGILLSLALMMPHFSYNGLAEATVVIVYFPLLVCLGAGSTLSTRMIPVCKFAGEISYPLYMTHYAAIWIFGNYFTQYHPGFKSLSLVVISGVIVLTLFAWLVMKYVDIPVRKYLTKRRLRKFAN